MLGPFRILAWHGLSRLGRLIDSLFDLLGKFCSGGDDVFLDEVDDLLTDLIEIWAQATLEGFQLSRDALWIQDVAHGFGSHGA